MKFSKLTIKNFRSTGADGLEITFSRDQNLAAIVGANASGKSNVLTALGIVLGVYPFSRFSPEETDFCNRQTDEELLIELYLDPPLIEHDVYRRSFNIAGFRYRVMRYQRGDRRGVLYTEHYCFDDEGKVLVKPVRMFRRKGQTDDGVDNTPRPLPVSEHAWKLGDLFYLDAPTLERFFDRTTGWSPLGRLFEIYREDFEADHNEYSPDGMAKMRSRDAFQQVSHTLADILRTAKLSEIETTLSARVSEYLGSPSRQPMRIDFSLPSHRDLFERWVGLQVSEHSGIPPLPVDCLGSGYRALLRLATLETLLEMHPDKQGFIVLIEEPEMYLHVHLRRHFYRVLRRLAAKGHQIVYTTHSPEFINLSRPQEVIRVHKQPGNPTISKQVSARTELNFERVEQKLRRMGNAEIVFANHAILTEGQDDQGVIEELLIRRGVHPDIHSISVVNCDGVGQIKDYVRLCTELGIDFYVVHDRDDDSKEDIKKRNAQLSAAVSDVAPKYPSLHVYNPTLEAAMGTEKKGNNLDRLLALLGDKNYEAITQAYPALVMPVDEFVATRSF